MTSSEFEDYLRFQLVITPFNAYSEVAKWTAGILGNVMLKLHYRRHWQEIFTALKYLEKVEGYSIDPKTVASCLMLYYAEEIKPETLRDEYRKLIQRRSAL